jgi:ketosteroid isomerase-like protein
MTATPDEQQIRDLLTTYAKALKTGDVELATSIYTEDAVVMGNEMPTNQGAEIRRSYETNFDLIRLDVEFTLDGLVVDGNIAYGHTRSQGTITMLATDDTVPSSARELLVFARQSGKWKIARYMFNKMSA